MPSQYSDRRVSVTGLLDDAFWLVRRNYKLFYGVIALFLVPCGMLQAALPKSLSLLATGVGLLETGLAGCALTIAVCERSLDRSTTVAHCCRVAVRRLGRAALAFVALFALLMAIVVVPVVFAAALQSRALVILCLLVSAGVALVLLIRYSLCVQVIALEGHGVGSLGRSFALTAGYFWKTVGLLLLTTVPVGISNVLTTSRVGQLTQGNHLAVVAVGLLLQMAAMPLTFGAAVLLYLDLRTKQEDFSRNALAGELDAL
jgi:hypothetical protein